MLKTDLQHQVLSGSTRLFGLIGNPIEHSISPVFWNRAFAYLGINAIYLPMCVKMENFKSAIDGLKALNFSGINVTMPFKKMAAASCSSLVGPSEILQSVNTMNFSGSEITGWNTDATGLLRILKNCGQVRTATIMGDGASSQSVIWALKQNSIKQIFQLSRRCEIIEELDEAEILIKKLPWNNKNFSYTFKESDIIFNTTPLGWKKEDFVIELEECLDQNKIYVDLNYAPYSRLLACARKTGCRVLDGRDLLLEQGLESFRLLTGFEPPAKVIRDCIFSQHD